MAARVPWATTSAGPAPSGFMPSHVLGGSDHWDPVAGSPASTDPVQH
jgi:hypothetical protein